MAAAKLHIPVVHVEAGLRSFDRAMPEEISRVVTDHLSDLLFCLTETAVKNLADEGITNGIHMVGDVMADALAFNREIAQKESRILELQNLTEKNYYILTIHGPGNTDNQQNLTNIIQVVGEAGLPVVFPIHPRILKKMQEFGLLDNVLSNIMIHEPLGYTDMIQLMDGAYKILTDSGGMQKEAYILRVPCITLRNNTEWLETLSGEWNVLVGSDKEKILSRIIATIPQGSHSNLFQTGASLKIQNILNIRNR